MESLVCSFCGRKYSAEELVWRCECGHPLDLDFNGKLDLGRIKGRPPGIWRYREALPIEDDKNIVSLSEGFTPLIAATISGRTALLKLDFLYPTGSFKDRGASVLISKAKELGVKKVVEDSSGNAGCAIAAYCARAGIECHIYVPESASPAKLLQIQAYGARLFKIPGTRTDVQSAALEAAKNIYYASHVWNPFFFQGTKTFGFEVFEQLNFQEPDTMIIPTGNGTLLIGAYLGFSELFHQHLIERIPRLIAVQAKACAPLYLAFRSGKEEIPEIVPEHTIAEGIAIPKPPRSKQVLEIIKKTGGEVLAVSEEEIVEGVRILNSLGIFAEPTSAVVIAAFLKMPQRAGEKVVLPITGHGLKTVDEYLRMGLPIS